MSSDQLNPNATGPEKRCPRCGGRMPEGPLGGLCPACLLDQAAETATASPADVSRFEALPPEEVAKLFPQLEILALIGAGGMGAVYRARQPGLNRQVALKVLPQRGGSGARFAERFNREAQALARLSHPNIVVVHEFGEAGGLHYFIMEFVDGANLRQLEKTGRLSPREALQIIPQICDALQYAHDEGVVHRDIKPENVLVDRKGRVKIADFGLAKILGMESEAPRLTAEGQVMGTPHYMAPEQVERPLAVDHRADIYSLGVVFYEMLTGDLPLGKFPPPSRKVEVDIRLDEVVLRALENDPERRYQQASEVKSRVETIAGTPTPGPAAAASAPRAPSMASPAGGAESGGRHPSWTETLRAWTLVGGFAIAGLIFLSATTGPVLMGWLGLAGWQSVVVRVLIGGLLVTSAVRRAHRPPPEARESRSAEGAVILPVRPPWRRMPPALLSVAVVVVALWLERSLMPRIMPALRSSARATAQVAARDGDSGVLVAELPGGGRIELLAIGEPDAALDGWWLPDGTPVTNTTYEVRGAAEGAASGRVSRDCLFHITDLPDGASEAGCETDPPTGGGSGGQVFRGGQLLPGAVQVRRAWPPDTREATIRIGFGLDPWRTIATQSVRSQSGTQTRLSGDPNWVVNFHPPPYGATGDAQVSVVFGPEDRLWTQRVLAVDTNGVEHAISTGQGTPIEKLTLWTYTWRDLPAAAVKEYQLQVRPVHWIGFRDVALQPARPVPPPHPARFGPVQERTFAELIDFDTGRIADYPPGRPDAGLFQGIGENVQWLRENGFDAEAGTGELHPMDMVFTALGNADWERLSASEVVKRIHENHYRPSVLKPLDDGSLPATFAFRTREQGIGLLQLVAFDPQRPGATVRFKLVTKRPRE